MPLILRHIFIVTAILVATSGAQAKDSPEKEAVDLFYSLCVLTGAKPDKIDEQIKPISEAGLGGEISSETLQDKTGIPSEKAWGFRLGQSLQSYLLTIDKVSCMVRIATGEPSEVEGEFLERTHQVADMLHGSVKKMEHVRGKLDQSFVYSAYAIDVPDLPNRLMLVVGTSDTVSAIGTKHIMTLIKMKKAEK